MVVVFCLDLQGLHFCSIPVPVFASVTSCIACLLLLWLCGSSAGCLTRSNCLGHFRTKQGNLLLSVYFCLIPAFANPVALYSLTLSFSNPCVLVNLGYYNRISWPGWLINNKLIFSWSRRLGSQRSRCSQIWCLGKAHLLLHSLSFSCCAHPHFIQGARELSSVSFIRALIPFIRPLWPNHLCKAPPLNAITLGIRFQHLNLGGMQTFCTSHW